jgi:hypothetical protein
LGSLVVEVHPSVKGVKFSNWQITKDFTGGDYLYANARFSGGNTGESFVAYLYDSNGRYMGGGVFEVTNITF